MHLQGHSGAAFFLQCRYCGVPCGDYDSFITHQNSCGAVQGGSTAADRQSLVEAQDAGALGLAHGGGRDHDNRQASNDDGHISEDAGERERGGLSLGLAENDSRSDDENSIEIVEDDNLPVHFMVKEETAESQANYS